MRLEEVEGENHAYAENLLYLSCNARFSRLDLAMQQPQQ
jgi:hypothetical protein